MSTPSDSDVVTLAPGFRPLHADWPWSYCLAAAHPDQPLPWGTTDDDWVAFLTRRPAIVPTETVPTDKAA